LNKEKKKNSREFSDEMNTALLVSSTEFLESIIADIFESKKDYFTFELIKIFEELKLAAADTPGSEAQSEWLEIDSLSKLRSTVGGRFASLKEKWLEAGFPLRKHRGDKESAYQVDEKGWLALVSWISKQGYEAQLSVDEHDYLFRLRVVQETHKNQ